MFKWASRGGTRPATPHITRLYIRIKFLPSKPREGGVCIFWFIKTFIWTKLIFHITLKKKIRKTTMQDRRQKTSMTNYRPTLLLNFFYGIWNLCTVDWAIIFILTTHWSQNSHNFRKELSSENAVLRLTDSVCKSIKKINLGGIFCVLAKGFDWINHEILLPKLHFSRIWWVSADWYRLYLTNRRQKGDVKSLNTTQFFFSHRDTLKRGFPKDHFQGL
jgi:hypothetical protein